MSVRFAVIGIHTHKTVLASLRSHKKQALIEACFVNPIMFHPKVRSIAPLQSTRRIIGFFTQRPMSSRTCMTNNIICAASHAAISSPSAILYEALDYILLLCAMGSLFKNTCKPPQHRRDLGSVASPESDIPSTVNRNASFLSQFVLGCIMTPWLGVLSTCCITHSIAL